MGNLRKQPIKQVRFQQFEFNHSVNCIAASIQGWRQYMQDRNTMVKIGDQNMIAGVFDGHGGHQVAKFVSQMFPRQLQNQPFYRMKNYQRALTNCYKRMDQMIDSSRGQDILKQYFKKMNPSKPIPDTAIKQTTGTTANIILITPDVIYNGNLGDTRSVLCLKNGEALSLSKDHKPNKPQQKARIVKAGGQVINNRINGNINISRTLGDFHYKQNRNLSYAYQMISCVPQVIQIQRNKQQNYIAIASDGVWEKYNNDHQKLVDQLNQFYNKQKNWKIALERFLHSLLADTVHDKSGFDNMTVMLIFLNNKKQQNNTSN